MSRVGRSGSTSADVVVLLEDLPFDVTGFT